MISRDYLDLIIGRDVKLIDAMRQMDRAPEKTLFVLDRKKCIASLSDGDIRRWIMSSGRLDAEVGQFANYNVCTVSEDDIETAEQLAKQKDIHVIPVLDESGHMTAIWIRDCEKRGSSRKKVNAPVVINAGGKGTRLYPYTKILPKPLIPIGDTPIVERIIRRFVEEGSHRFFMILNYKGNMIKAYFSDIEKDYELDMVNENKSLGTGGGLSLLKGKINEPFFFTNCDTIITDELARAYRTHVDLGNEITMICCMKGYKIPYGVIEVDEDGMLKTIREKPEIDQLTNTGTYIVNSEILDRIPDDTSISFPEIIQDCIDHGLRVGVFPISPDSWLDMGQMDEMENMKRSLRIKDE